VDLEDKPVSRPAFLQIGPGDFPEPAQSKAHSHHFKVKFHYVSHIDIYIHYQSIMILLFVDVGLFYGLEE
jgi:hypothetical protein